MKRLLKLRLDQCGATAVEFALVSPILIVLILGALQLGQVLRANAGLRELAGWAGREAVVSFQSFSGNQPLGPEELEASIEERAALASYNLRNGTLDVNVTNVQDTTLLTVNRVRVQLNYDYNLSLPFLPAQTINLTVDRTFFVPN